MSMQSSADRPRASARQALLDAAAAEFASKGYEAATVAGIARRAGVTTGAIYAHFRSKLELLLEAVGLHTADTFVRRALGIAKRPAREMAHSLARGLVGTPIVQRDILLIDAIVRARRDPAIAQTYRRVIDAHVEGFERTARLGIESGRIDPILALDELARLVVALAFGVMVLRALEQAPPSDETGALLVEQLLRPATAEPGANDPLLARVQIRARAAERAEADLHAAIRQAAAAGRSLRRVGAAAGLSHERIRKIVGARRTASGRA
jgi:AcrR family transcriptional regulator